MKKLLPLVIVMLFYHITSAQLIFNENFNYSIGNLTNSAAWTAYNASGIQPVQVVTGGLHFDGYSFSDKDGKSIKLNPTNQGTEDVYSNFSSSVSNGTFYLSFLVKVDLTTPPSNTNPLDFLSISSSSRLTSRGRLCAIETSAGTYKFRLIWGANTTQFSETSTTFNYGSTYLIVLKYNKLSGTDNDKISLYVFDSAPPSMEPASAVIAPFGYAGEIDPSSVNIQQLGPSSTPSNTTPQNITIDGMAAAKTWSAIFGGEGEIISFNAADTAGLKQGNIGFLHSINNTAPIDSFVTLIKPKIWRVGRYNDAFTLYNRLKNDLGVERQILVLSDLRTEQPYRSIYLAHGYGAMTDSIISHTQALGLDYEFDIFNEPNRNDSLKNDLSAFMTKVWNPAYHAIRTALPNAKIHGPSTGINSFDNPDLDSLALFHFIDSAIAHNTLPDYINWHCQIGYSIADWHMEYSEKIKSYIASKGHTILGTVVGETVRPGSERNTSPGVLADVFAAAEVGNIPQIHAAWSSSRVYGISTSIPPVLCGILTDSTGLGRRGAWWTYRFFADTEGQRIKCENTPSGSENFVGVAFKDDNQQVLRAIVGLRDTKGKQNSQIVFNNLDAAPYISDNGKTHLKVWYNHQTQYDVSGFGTDSLPKIMDMEVEIYNNKINIPVSIDQWDAVLIELSKPGGNTVAANFLDAPFSTIPKNSYGQDFFKWIARNVYSSYDNLSERHLRTPIM
ncbi:MAG: hypothetical protein ACTIKE_15360 [Sphingobacterium sp.]